MKLECRKNCGHSESQHDSFDSGYFAGLQGIDEPPADEPNKEIWHIGNSVDQLVRN